MDFPSNSSVDFFTIQKNSFEYKKRGNVQCVSAWTVLTNTTSPKKEYRLPIPTSTSVSNLPTHILLFGNVSRGQDFYEFLFFFFRIVQAPTSQTTLLIKPLSNTVTDCLGYRVYVQCHTHTEIHSNGIFVITHSKYIHDISPERGEVV